MNDAPVLLHVDDDEQCLDLSRSSFERSLPEVELITRDDAEAALSTLSVESVDLLVSDSIELDDGTPFVEVVRNEYPDLPIVLYTGSELSQIAPVISRAGVTEYVPKRVDTPMSALVDRVDRLVDEVVDDTGDAGARPADGSEARGHPGRDDGDREWTRLAECDPTSTESLAVTLAEVLGDRAADRPLLDLFDVEAAADLFAGADEDVPIQFRARLDTHELAVTSEGVVAISPLPQASD
jgi:CheY-like chemotaxis protein